MSNSANYLTYGPVTINITQVKQYKKEPMYLDKEKTIYSLTRHTLDIEGVMSMGDDIDPLIVGPNDVDVIDQESTVRHFLTQPRLKLQYVIGGKTLLESPVGDDVVDCSNGPKPLAFTIQKINGVNTANISFTIQTDLQESHLWGGAKFAVLANSYSMEHIIDHDLYSIRKVTGVVQFRSDVLLNNDLSPDDFREIINIPTPDSMKRDLIKCRLMPDSLKMEYSFIDREVHFRLDNSVYDDKVKQAPTLGSSAIKMAKIYSAQCCPLPEAPYPFMKNITRVSVIQNINIVHTDPLASATSAVTNPASGFMGKLMQGASVAGTAIPQIEENLTVQVYGNNFSEKKDLEYCALFIMQQRMPNNWEAGTYSFSLEEDVIGSFVTLRIMKKTSIIAAGAALLSSGIFGWNQANNAALQGKAVMNSAQSKIFGLNISNLYGKNFFGNPNASNNEIPGVVVKTYDNGVLNSEIISGNVRTITSRKQDEQMRGTYMEQLFVSGIRETNEEFPVDEFIPPYSYNNKDYWVANSKTPIPERTLYNPPDVKYRDK